MNKYETLLLALESAEIGQSLVVALFVILLHFKNKKKSMLFLAIYFLLYAIASIVQAGLHFKYITNDLFVVPSALHFIAYSFFYAHINLLLINSNNKKANRIFVIGISAMLLGFVIVLCMFFAKIASIYIIIYLYEILALIFLLYVSVLLIIDVKKHNNLVTNQYSSTENRKLQFVFYWIIVFMTYLIVFLFVTVEDYIQKLMESIISFIWTIGFAYNALFHQISKNLFEEKEISVPKPTKIIVNTTADEMNNENNRTVETTNERYSVLMEKIKQQIQNNELYLDSEFTISNLAYLVGEHPKLVSQVINTITNQNFNAYINQFRVLYAKKMLMKPENKYLNIEGIGNLSGFKSNSTFYAAFRKHLNCTPLQFLKKQDL